MNKVYKKIVPISLIFILFLQFIVVFYMNCTRTATFLDFDSALALRHAVEIWKNKQLVFPDFESVSSLEIDCVPFLAAPFYIMTGNAGVAYAVCHLIMMVLYVFTVFDILGRCGIGKRYACLASILIFTPYASGQLDYYNMLFISAGQYEFRVLTVLLGIDVLLIKKSFKIKEIFIILAFLGFLILTTLSTGTYMIVAIVCPMILFLALEFLFDKKNFLPRKAAFVVLSMILCVFILYMRKYYFGAGAGRAQYLCPYPKYSENILNAIMGIFTLLGGILYVSTNVFSAEGMQSLIKLVFLIVMFGFEIHMIRKKKLFTSSPLVRACVLVTAVQLFILIVADTNYGAAIFEYRYHILWVVENFICFIVCLYEYTKKTHTDSSLQIKKYMAIVLSFFLAVSNIYGFYKLYIYNSYIINTVFDINSVAQENNKNKILFYGKEEYTSFAHVLRATDIQLNALVIKDTFDSAHILDYYHGAGDLLAVGPDNILVTTKDAFKTIPEYLREDYSYVGEKNGNVFYITENSKWDFQSGFPKYLDESADYIESELYSCTKDNEGNVTAETQFTAPYDSYKYNYSINVEFSGDSSGHAGLTLEGADFELNDTDDDGKLSIENIGVLQCEELSLSLTYPSDMKIDRIIFTRKSK